MDRIKDSGSFDAGSNPAGVTNNNPAKMVFKNKLLICGPCAVESEHQLFETAKQIKRDSLSFVLP